MSMARSVVMFITLLHQYYLIYEPELGDRLRTLVFRDLEPWLFRNLEMLYPLKPPPS